MDRRVFLKSVGVLIATGVLTREQAHALENSYREIKLSPSLVQEWAIALAESMGYGNTLTIEDPIPLYKLDGSQTGCEVDYTYNGRPHGFVLFDFERVNLISQFSLQEGVPGPYARAEQNVFQDRSTPLDFDAPKLYRLNEFEYAAIDSQSGDLVSNSNTISSSIRSMSRAVPTTTWDSIMVHNVYGNGIEIESISYGIPVGIVSIGKLEKEKKKYACAVSALYSIGTELPFPDYNPSHFKKVLVPANDLSYYDDIWSDTSTQTLYKANGVTYGITNNNQIGPGFKKFCSRSARVINSTFIANPSYQQFQKQVLAGKHSVFAAGINTMVSGRIEDSGHAMAVEGVARFGPKGQGVKFSYLHVFDGWNDKVFIDYSFTGYTRKHGIFFHD